MWTETAFDIQVKDAYINTAGGLWGLQGFTLSIKTAQRPYIIVSLGPKALKSESLEGKG